MGYLDKSLENEKVTKELAEKDYYDGAINRYYYSIFQLILHILNEKWREISKSHINNASSLILSFILSQVKIRYRFYIVMKNI